ncbi:hypothetical protein D3C76_376870 [compost metagenome]
MAFTRRVITKELDMANLEKHNANYSEIKSTLDAHEISVINSTNHIANGDLHTTLAEKTKLAGITSGAGGANSATDNVIGSRTATDSVMPSLTGTITALFSSLFTLIKGITGKTSALAAPGITLEATKTHVENGNLHTSTVEKSKLAGIAVGAEVNQNAFAQVNNILADTKSDTLNVTGGTGITITSNPTNKTVTITATGTATPGAHASSHLPGGSDPIALATPSAAGLMAAGDKTDLATVKTKVTALEDFLGYMPIDGGTFSGSQTGPTIDGGTI